MKQAKIQQPRVGGTHIDQGPQKEEAGNETGNTWTQSTQNNHVSLWLCLTVCLSLSVCVSFCSEIKRMP